LDCSSIEASIVSSVFLCGFVLIIGVLYELFKGEHHIKTLFIRSEIWDNIVKKEVRI